MDGAPRVRIAPSPTGDPHVGTAYVALFNWAVARANGGKFVLRIDDTDRTRYRAESEAAIQRSLEWLGLDWDEGPDHGGPHAPYRQSERLAIYREKVDELLEKGAAYRCFCTAERLAEMREKQRAAKESGGYDRRCRRLPKEEVQKHLDAGTDHVVRLAVPFAGATTFTDELRGPITVQNKEVDDQVLMKSDGFPTYHLANVVDDIAFGITHVTRAEEWIISTPKHVMLYEAFGAPLPRFYHVPLLRNTDGSKISKRKNPVSLEFYREEGYLPEALCNFLANMGWSSPSGEEIFDRDHFRDEFRLEKIHLGSPVFDMTKLEWMNGVYLRQLSPEQLTERLSSEGFLPDGADAEGVAAILPLVAERLHRLGDFKEMTSYYFGDPDPIAAEDLAPKKLEPADGARLLHALAARLDELSPWELDGVDAALEAVREELEFKKPQLFMPFRAALTGRKNTPPITEVAVLLGKDRVVQRLRAAAEIAEQG